MAEQHTADERIAKLEARVVELEKFVAALRGAVVGDVSARVADDDELDDEKGDPSVRKDPTPRYWKGESFRGKRLSECPPEYLDAFAKYKDTCAHMTEKGGDPAKQKYAGYDRLDAARARGWSRRLRSGWTPPAPPAEEPHENPFAASNGSPNGIANGHAPANGFGDSHEPAFGGGADENPFASRQEFDDEERAAIQEEALDETERPL